MRRIDDHINPKRRNKDMRVPKEAMPELPSKTPIVGTRSLFNPEYVHIAKVMMERGAKYSDLAEAFRVELSTIKTWMDNYPEFKEAIIAAQDYFNMALIEKSLIRRATGYDYFEDTQERTKVGRKIIDVITGLEVSEDQFHVICSDEGTKAAKERHRFENKYEFVLTKRIKKHVSASDRAIEFFLNNRTPIKDEIPRWQPMNKIELTGKDGKDLIPDSITPEKFLAELVAQQRAKDEAIDAEFEETKALGITTGEEDHKDEQSPR